MSKNRAAAGHRAGRAWSFTGDEACKIVVGDEEGRLAMMRGGGCVFVCGRQMNELWMDGGRQFCVCVWLRWMVVEEEEGGMEGIYYFAMQWFSAGGGEDGI